MTWLWLEKSKGLVIYWINNRVILSVGVVRYGDSRLGRVGKRFEEECNLKCPPLEIIGQ